LTSRFKRASAEAGNEQAKAIIAEYEQAVMAAGTEPAPVVDSEQAGRDQLDYMVRKLLHLKWKLSSIVRNREQWSKLENWTKILELKEKIAELIEQL
jgi:ribosomal protein S6